MRVGEISKKTGLSKDTIRFYEKKGLLKVRRTPTPFNNYKEYSQENLKRLELIIKAKQFGFTLNEIADLLNLHDLKLANCFTLQQKVKDKLEEIECQIQELYSKKNLILSEVQKAQIKCQGQFNETNCDLLK